MKEITMGLIAGRHPLPVEEFIISEDIAAMDFAAIRRMVKERLVPLLGISVRSGIGLNQADATDVEVYESDVHLSVYVTGLTPVTAEVARFCALNGVRLTLLHYDRDSGEYLPQDLF